MLTYCLYYNGNTGEMINGLKVYTEIAGSTGVSYSILDSSFSKYNIRVYTIVI